MICRLGSFDLKVTGGKRHMGPRDVSSSPSLAVITPEKHFSPSASSSPPFFIDSMCQWWRGKKKQQTLSDFLDDDSFLLCTEEKGSKQHHQPFAQTICRVAPRKPYGLCDFLYRSVTFSLKRSEREKLSASLCFMK